jgi:hypothetical protein
MDFSILSDEQLIELIKGALGETIKRGQTVVDAAREVMLDEKREAEIKARATQRAQERIIEQEADRLAKDTEKEILAKRQAKEAEEKAEKIKNMWLKEKAQAEKLLALLGDRNLYLSIWEKSPGVDRRMYLKADDFFGKDICCLFVTGNSKESPKSLTSTNLKKYTPNGKDFNDFRNEVKDLLLEINNNWKSGRFDIAKALKYEE